MNPNNDTNLNFGLFSRKPQRVSQSSNNPYNEQQDYCTPYDDQCIRPQKTLHTKNLYYQIATYPHRQSHLFHVKKYLFDPSFEQLNEKEYWLSRKQIDKLMKSKPEHQYKTYPVFDLYEIQQPKMAELMVAASDMMASDYDYSGCAPF